MKFLIAIDPGTPEHPDFSVIVPDLPGCYSQGDDLEDAVEKAKESIELWIEGMLDEGSPLPLGSSPSALMTDPEFTGRLWAVAEIDPAKILDKAERVNITLPGRVLRRLDTMAEKAGETRSGFIARLVLTAS